jgi:osmoprotectant transport system ATP-binding protein
VIRFEGVAKEYVQPGRPPHRALEAVDVTVERGETLCLIGASGCGKTTMLRLVNRLIEPTAGRVLVDGVDVATQDPVALRRRMGYVIQSGALFPHLTVAGNVGLLARIEEWDEARIDARVRELLELVHLEPARFAARYPAELSGGQRQRVGVARALMLDPEILLMDEPFGALDPITRAEVQADFLDLAPLAEKTVLLVTHDLDEAFRLGDRAALLAGGRLVQVGTPRAFRDAPADEHVRAFVARHFHGDPRET